jgi:ribosomal protein S18 acetylase RimI-like enzyme
LIERARELAEATRANCLTLETAANNIPAQRLYESLGWKREQEFYRYYLPL